MPLPPIHGLDVLYPYFKRKATFDPLALVAGATFVDLEPLVYYLLGLPPDAHMWHGVWHGYTLTLTVYPALVGLFVYTVEHLLENQVWSAYSTLGFKPVKVKYSVLTVYLCCLAGGVSHMFFDMFTHQNLPYVLFPFALNNPLYLGSASGMVEIAALAIAVYSVFLWWRNTKTSQAASEGKPKENRKTSLT
jgi:hypothetical protein